MQPELSSLYLLAPGIVINISIIRVKGKPIAPPGEQISPPSKTPSRLSIYNKIISGWYRTGIRQTRRSTTIHMLATSRECRKGGCTTAEVTQRLSVQLECPCFH